MNQNSLIEVLEANRLLRSSDEVALFEQTLEKLAQNPDPTDLPSLHLILDDACQHPEVMFGLVHFLESFDLQAQVQAFIQVMPDLVKRAAEWTAILHSRMMNDDVARSAFEERVQMINKQDQDVIQHFLVLASSQKSSTKIANVV